MGSAKMKVERRGDGAREGKRKLPIDLKEEMREA